MAHAASMASIGARRKATCSDGPRAASSRWGALLINCMPIDHVAGMIAWLRDFTELPLGAYPNLGHMVGTQWHFDEHIGPAEYAQQALSWREQGPPVIG